MAAAFDPQGDPEAVAGRFAATRGDARARALEALVQRGKPAVPALLAALGNKEAEVRALAAEGLASIADPSTADRLAAALDDDDGRVRSQAAVALAGLGDHRGPAALIRTLNDDPDVLHSFMSRSSYALVGLGPRALPAVAPLLRADDETTRERAIWVIRMVASAMQDVDGYPQLQRALSAYDAAAPADRRGQAAGDLTAWIGRHASGGGRNA